MPSVTLITLYVNKFTRLIYLLIQLEISKFAFILNKQEIDTLLSQLQLPSTVWSETCTTTLILLISDSFGTCNVNDGRRVARDT